MLSHWYNHDNVGNTLKTVRSASAVPRMEANYLKVPDLQINSSFVLPQQSATSTTSINSNKGSNMNLRDGSPNFRVPWKIVLLGEAGVGKTSIIKQYLNGNFNTYYNPTVEDSYLHNINLPDGLNQCIEILDTSGFYQFPAMRELNIRLGTAFVLVFDLTKEEESHKSLVELRQTIYTIKGTENIPIVIVGNKSDLINEKSKVASNLDEKLKSQYLESSAKDNVNVSQIFKMVIDLILKEIEETREALNAANNISRRNSTISFVRRISTHNLMGLKADHSARRYSEPVCVDNIKKEKSNKKSDKNNSKDNTKGFNTPTTTRRKQKNCIIS